MIFIYITCFSIELVHSLYMPLLDGAWHSSLASEFLSNIMTGQPTPNKSTLTRVSGLMKGLLTTGFP